MQEILLRDLDIVTCYDPARTRESEYGRRARACIMTTGCDQEYNIYVLRYLAARASFDALYDELKAQVTLYQPRCIAIEDIATQIAIGDAFRKIAAMEKFRMPPIIGVRPDTRVNKKWRIKTTLQRVASYGKLHILPSHYELESEWVAFPNGLTVDILDVLAYLVQLHGLPDDLDAEDYNARVKAAMAQTNVVELDDYRPRGHDDVYDDPRYQTRKPPPGGGVIWRYA